MASWVVDRGRSLWTSRHAPYLVGGKRRVSHSEGGDIGDNIKRTRVALDEHRPEWHGPIPNQEEYNYLNNNRYAAPPNDFSAAYPPDGGECSSSFLEDDDVYHHQQDHDRDMDATPPPPRITRDFIPVKGGTFYVIQERSRTPEYPPVPPIGLGPGPASGMGPVLAPPVFGAPIPGACAMERTASGLSVSSDTTSYSLAHFGQADNDRAVYVGDLEAANEVLDHIFSRRRFPDSLHSRILKALISPKALGNARAWNLDNDALESIFSTANELFFANRLTGRVAWDWSHPASEQYEVHIVGTTAVRRSKFDPKHSSYHGYEMLIVLSSPILRDTKYNRRLLISTFLHEMIHSYLFVACGIKAGHDGGHTEGFRLIAEAIDDWVGRGHLRLGEMEADLEQFREPSCKFDHERGYDRDDRSTSRESERRMREESPWERRDGSTDRDRDEHDFYPIEHHRLPPQQHRFHQEHLQQHPDYDDWQWPRQDGFCSHSHGGRGEGSPYV